MRLPWLPLAAVTLGAMVLSGCSDGVSVSACGPFDFSDVDDTGRRNLEVRTDRVIAGNGDHVCVRAKFYGEAPGGELRMKVARDRKLVSLNSEKTGNGEWTAVWKPAGPGEWNVGAFFEGDESFVTGTSVEVGDAGGEFGDATVTGACATATATASTTKFASRCR